jgi:hypothetical protein
MTSQSFEAGCAHVILDPPAGTAHLATPNVLRCDSCATAYMHAAVVADPDLCDSCRLPTQPSDFHEVALVMDTVAMQGNVCGSCLELVLQWGVA